MSDNRDYKAYSENEVNIFLFLRNLRYEFENYPNKLYINVCNKVNLELETIFKNPNRDYMKMLILCDNGMRLIKAINGNHFHIWLFFKLELRIKKEMLEIMKKEVKKCKQKKKKDKN